LIAGVKGRWPTLKWLHTSRTATSAGNEIANLNYASSIVSRWGDHTDKDEQKRRLSALFSSLLCGHKRAGKKPQMTYRVAIRVAIKFRAHGNAQTTARDEAPAAPAEAPGRLDRLLSTDDNTIKVGPRITAEGRPRAVPPSPLSAPWY